MNFSSLMTRRLCTQFLRYIFVGGIAFLADISTMVLFREYVFPAAAWGVYAAVLMSFIVGLTVNYLLSLAFVFNSADERNAGRTLRAFIEFAAVGVAGVGITEAGMWFFYGQLSINYILAKSITAMIVLFWNFIGRKVAIDYRCKGTRSS